MKTGKGKRIVALAGVIILAGLYVLTLISAVLAKPYAHGLFLASVFSSFIIPVLIYGFLVVTKAFGKKEGELTMREYHKIKKEMKNQPEEQEASEEIENSQNVEDQNNN